MSANAREWVDDCWHANYENAPSVNHRWGEENNGQCNFPVLRGEHGYITLITYELPIVMLM